MRLTSLHAHDFFPSTSYLHYKSPPPDYNDGLPCDACVRRCHTVSKETPARPSSPANDTLLPNGHKLEHFFLIFYIIPLFYLLTEPSKRICPHLVGRAGGMACRCYGHRCSCCCFLSVLCYFCSATFDFPLPVKMGWMDDNLFYYCWLV